MPRANALQDTPKAVCTEYENIGVYPFIDGKL
jgi:hypothetical protein